MPTLQIHGVSKELLGRINAAAELLTTDRDEMVIGWLEKETRKLSQVQNEMRSDQAESKKGPSSVKPSR